MRKKPEAPEVPEELPEGIKALRDLDDKAKNTPGFNMKKADFDAVNVILMSCSGNDPDVINCETCEYYLECTSLQSFISGKTDYSKKGK